ncbi:PP2C family protein-serine/threonine phosphatase [Pseudomonas mosselii]|uniref:PP2C family protein-serine/threonine phosphatase n=1 Tax=Pseudomonas mosselii TaxID=78327 RepID=UPI0011B5871D|nr:protein phosphatase 2C domain-containing protein [Pseudomonas mosselii]
MGILLSESIRKWLSRKVPGRGVQSCYDIPVIISTDIGLQRKSNQDRAAMLRLGAVNGGRGILAVVLADGMGGMQEGDKCAELAIASFFSSLLAYRDFNLQSRVKFSILEANDRVNHAFEGRGGATLTGLIVDDEGRALIVHVGDSRAYEFGGGGRTKRLTTDDSLQEAVGGHGRELLQFAGMGAGISPHLVDVSSDAQSIAITTDGVHYVDSKTFDDILYYSPDIKSASERISALSRWCGSPDNASSALMDLPGLKVKVLESEPDSVELWDAFGHVSFAEVIVPKSNLALIQHELGLHGRKDESLTKNESQRTKKIKSSKVKKRASHEFELDVEINGGSASEGGDVSRK